MTDTNLLVVSFDFGTTYSGYAFSFRDNPLKVQANQGWIAGSDKLISLKTPTCVLLNPKKEFDSFGYEAENTFSSLAEDDKHHDWLFFQRFKMVLHTEKDLSRTTTVEDINGKKMPALTIFAMSIRYLKDHFLEALNKQKTGIEANRDIKYVITVPAIWSDSAKQFMREAAEQAGIDTKLLKLSYEPEAASIWCQTIPTTAKERLSKAGNQYMVIDLGGGTADISVHEKQIDNTLKELHKPSGGPWGGTVVDDNFLKWLTELYGAKTMQKFKEEQMEDYFLLLREFEIKKRNIKTDSKGKITIRVSASLKDLYQEHEKGQLKDRIVDLGQKDMVTFTGDKLRVDASIIKGWFDAPISKLLEHVQHILKEPFMSSVETILLVGGFGESNLVHDRIQASIRNKHLVIPEEAGLVVLKGAVQYGHAPDTVTSRLVPHTYGLGINQPFDNNKHSGAEVVFNNGMKMADNVFRIIIQAGERITIGQTITKGPFTPNSQNSSTLRLYSTDEIHPKYTTDPGCKHLGTLTVSLCNGRSCFDNRLNVSFIFGDTEIQVKAVNTRTGEEFSTYIDCL